MPNPNPGPRCPVCGQEHTGPLPGFCTRPSCGVELLAGTPDRLGVRTFGLANHFSLCVLPFTFAEMGKPPVWQRLTAGGRWRERLFSLDNADDLDRTEYFLPYIRRFLFPSLFRTDKPGDSTPARQSCWHFTFDLSLLGSTDRAGLALTLTGRESKRNMTFEYPLLLQQIELLVFSYRVGFLVLHFQCRDAGATYFDQMDSLNYLRTIAPLFRGFEIPELVTQAGKFRMPQFLPYLLAEFDPGVPVPAAPAAIPERTPLPVKPVYDDRMMVYTFSCVDCATSLNEPARCQALLEKAAIINFDLRETKRPRDEPLTRDVAVWMQQRWQGFSKDGGCLVVFDTDRFHARFLGVYHGTYYFDIFLLAALQRVTLLSLFESFSDIHTLITGSSASRKLVRKVRRDLLLFKNQCWFSQITNRERGLVLWKKWQRVLETRTLLTEVNEQSEELSNYLQSRYRERIEWLVRLGAFLAAALPVVFGLERFLGNAGWVQNLRWILLGVLILGSLIFGWYVWFRQTDEA